MAAPNNKNQKECLGHYYSTFFYPPAAAPNNKNLKKCLVADQKIKSHFYVKKITFGFMAWSKKCTWAKFAKTNSDFADNGFLAHFCQCGLGSFF